MRRLEEAIETFTQWVDDARLNKAVIEWQPKMSTQEGQIELLNAAADGINSAVDFLFLRFTKLISKIFWTTFLGPDKKYHRVRIENKEDIDFASIAYSMLAGKEPANPHDTFDPTLFGEDADLVKQFGYYYYRYLQKAADKYNRQKSWQGLGGNIPSDETIEVVSYDTLDSLNKEPSSADFSNAVVERQSIEQFMEYLKTINDKFYEVFYLRLTGHSLQDVAKKFGQTTQAIRNNLAIIKDLYEEFTER